MRITEVQGRGEDQRKWRNKLLLEQPMKMRNMGALSVQNPRPEMGSAHGPNCLEKYITRNVWDVPSQRRWEISMNYLNKNHSPYSSCSMDLVERVLVSRFGSVLCRGWCVKRGKNRSSYPCNRLWKPIGLCDMEALIFSLENRLTDGNKVVSLTHPPGFTPQEDSWYSFLLEAESIPRP
jgi:hypothetical protein